VNFSPQTYQRPHSGSSRYSTEDLLSQESTRSSSLGQGMVATYSSGEDNESSDSLGKTLELFIEQVAEQSCQQAASNLELQLQRLQEKMRYLENNIRTEEEYRTKLWETVQKLDARLESVEQQVKAIVSTSGEVASGQQVERENQEITRQSEDSSVHDETCNKHLVERIETLEAQLEAKLCLKNESSNPGCCNEVSGQRRDAKHVYQSSLSRMDRTIKKIDARVDEAMKKLEEASLMQSSAHERLSQRIKQIDDLQTSVDAVKKLLEHNLRVQNGAESIVKEQANIIIKHVCAAMQQYTLKRINEYNAFLDSVLRKYLPNYNCEESESLVTQEEELHDS